MQINYVKGDLFQLYPKDRKVVIAHCCNCKGGFGSGFVIPLKQHFPIVAERYLSMFPAKRDIMGYTQWVYINEHLTVANMVAQTLGGVRPLNYYALAKAMQDVVHENEYVPFEIHAPMFGSALAGGNWNFVEELIRDIWLTNNIPVTIYWRDDNIPEIVQRELNENELLPDKELLK